MSAFISSSKRPAQTKPMIGDTISAASVSWTFPQFTPSPNVCDPNMSEFARPTPTMEPIRVCELDAGRPKYHVPRFQIIAEIRSEKTIAKPADDPTLITSSTGRSATIPNATAPDEASTPVRFQRPDQTTATHGRKVFV